MAVGVIFITCVFTFAMPPFNVHYSKTLAGFDAKSYQDKIQLCGGLDPYESDPKDYSENPKQLPEVVREDLINYLVLGTEKYTLKEMKCHKALEAHNYVTSGWVHYVRAKKLDNGRILVIGKVG